MEAGIWPVSTPDPSMFDRIPVNIVYVPVEILIVPDHVLPKSALPNPTLASLRPALGNPFTLFDSARELTFDQIPAGGKICVIGRESPNAMKMIRQNHDRFQAERMPQLNAAKKLLAAVQSAPPVSYFPAARQDSP